MTAAHARVDTVTKPAPAATGSRVQVDEGSQAWLERLRGTGAQREAAIAELHGLLVRAAGFEINRRRRSLPGLPSGDAADLAQQCADDALVSILGKLDDFRGESRFTTWAYKFALFEAAAGMRRRSWQGREIPFRAETWPELPDRSSGPDGEAEMGELLSAIRQEIHRGLSPHQQEVFVALALNEVPIDVLAARLNTTRGALYKTLYDARQKLRTRLAARGFDGLRQGTSR